MKYILLLTCILGAVSGFAQIVNGPVRMEAPGRQLVLTTYSDGSTDLYVIQNTDNEPNPQFGVVQFTPDGSNGWEYEWSYNGTFQPVVYQGDSTYMRMDLPGEGVYYLKGTKAGSSPVEAEFHVFYSFLDVTISLNSVENEMDCENVTVYLNIVPPQYGSFPGEANEVEYKFFEDGRQLTYFSLDNYNAPSINWEVIGKTSDKKGKVEIKDRFGIVWESNEVIWHSYIPKADFSATPMNGEAPLEVTFTSASENADYFEWYLYKDTNEIKTFFPTLSDSLLQLVYYGEHLPPYTYEHPGEYQVKLVVVNTQGINRCSDTLLFEAGNWIVVDSSLLDVPNVFTPNGDGINDLFQAKSEQSLKFFHGIILNRWGRKVYEWRDPEGGWDGRIGGKYASPGTYFYIITATGREIDARKYIQKGALLLVR
ncbi:MAG: gliding motility-associated C-terminal domain-containing protein [Culturomica sp.]|jgi:gliding motility-associated-like protein|nr:gliding motility-associated C-terminal domain-containing protein [Culturomica sp.]